MNNIIAWLLGLVSLFCDIMKATSCFRQYTELTRSFGIRMLLRLLANLVVPLSFFLIPIGITATADEDNFEFKHADDSVEQVDPDLNEWLTQQTTMSGGPATSEAGLASLPKDLDDVSLLVAKLHALRGGSAETELAGQTVDLALAKVNKFLDGAPEENHILYAYLLSELIAEPSLHPRVHNFLVEKLRDSGGESCPRARLVLDDLTTKKWADVDVKELRKLLGEISQFKSLTFRRAALEMVLQGTPEVHRSEIADDMRVYLEPFPRLMESHSWVLEPGTEGALQSQLPKTIATRNFLLARAAVAHKNCMKAREHFLAALAPKVAESDRLQVEIVGTKIEDCFRASGPKARLEFWVGVKDKLGQSMGFAGEEIAMRRMGALKWGGDQFEEAIRIFGDIRARAEGEKLPQLEGNAIFSLGKIEENQGHIDNAIAYYNQYINEFDEFDKADEALMAVTILLIEKGQKKEALEHAQKIIDKFAALPSGNWDENSLSFALFWAGQLLYESGDTEAAAKMWRRLAGEFYSTYYGAIGHYLVEKIEKKPFLLQPVPTVPFKWNEVYARLGKGERQLIDRVMALQHMGFRQDALCEMAELPGGGNNYDRDLAIALLRHVMGDWLPAIKKYGELPHSYRNTLPQGMERILFPRAYVADIEKYSSRLSLDPDFVLAIIRQESVFNPRAVSSVGATGLMQLMPLTAAREMHKLGANYLTGDERSKFPRGSALANSLNDVDINITLGVHHVYSLMHQFENPVFMLSAYNANPAALARWSRNIPTSNLLTFVERIPYKETKAYVKLVMRNYFYYKRWYRGANEPLPYIDALLPQALRKGGQVTQAEKPAQDNPQGG